MIRPTWQEIRLGYADLIAKRSRCVRSQVGAIIVSKDDRILSEGYNGPPPNWLPTEKDCSAIEQKYNGSRDLKHEASCKDFGCPRATGERKPNNYDNCVASHAEQAALDRCSHADRVGGTIFVTSVLCFPCAKAVAMSGLSTVVMVVNAGEPRTPKDVRAFLEQSQIRVVEITR